MTNLQKLINFLSEPDYASKLRIAQNTGKCVICNRQVKEFSTKPAKFEYDVSGLCERCQETYIHNSCSISHGEVKQET